MRLITLVSNQPTIFYLKYAENWKHDTWVLVEIRTSGHNTPTSECVQQIVMRLDTALVLSSDTSASPNGFHRTCPPQTS